MLVLLTLVFSVVFVILSSGKMKKYPAFFYTGGAAVTVTMILLNNLHISGMPVIISQWIMPAFTKGISAAALWFTVAVTGALPNGSAAIRRLMPVRGELSVFSAVITLSHAVTYGTVYMRRLTSGSTDADFTVSFLICLALMIIMIPLTVISFKKIRKKMNPGAWKKVQRCAYVFYALIYMHIFVIYLQKRNITADSVISMSVYSLMFFGYAYLRIRKYCTVRKKYDNRTVLNAAAAVPFFLTVLFTSAVSGNVKTVSPEKGVTDSGYVSEQIKKDDFPVSTVTDSGSALQTSSVSCVTTVPVSVTQSSTESTSEFSGSESVTEIPPESEPEENPSDETEHEENHEEQPPEVQDNPAENQNEPVYIYRSGTYTASAYGYDGDITVTVTIENDVITDISAYSAESDTWYFESAFESVKNQILASQSTAADAVSGATFSSNAIMSAVQKALDSALN